MDAYLRASPTLVLTLAAVVVGLVAGFGAEGFSALIHLVEDLSHRTAEEFMGRAFPWSRPLVTALGGLLVGLLVHFLAREAKGHGVPEVMLAVAAQGGVIRPRVSLVKALASSITIGSGASAGREGPIVQIGSSFGSAVGQMLRQPRRSVQLLVACGAAGGISATFNAPIAGVMFALEVILQDFAPSNFGFVVISAVLANLASGLVRPHHGPTFGEHAFEMGGLSAVPSYVLVGVACALIGTLYSKGLYWMEDRADSVRMPEWVKPAIGAALTGALAIVAPQVMHVGYGSPHNRTVEALLGGGAQAWAMSPPLEPFPVWLTCLALALAKMLATWMTLGWGGSGGVFAPSLFIGAAVGCAVGNVVQPAHAGAFALAGMASLFAAASRAPITAVLIVFEMTKDYGLILGIMAATVVGTLLAQVLTKESIYTLKLRRRGIRIDLHSQAALMDSVLVGDAMTPLDKTDAVGPEMAIEDCVQAMARTGHHGLPVLADDGSLYGVVTLSDLQSLSGQRVKRGDLTVADACTRKVITCYPDMTLNEALAQVGARGVGRLPVVERLRPHRVVGVLRRNDIVNAYARASADRSRSLEKVTERGWLDSAHMHTVEYTVRPDDALEGLRVSELRIPEGCLLASLRRGNRIVIPKGETVLSAGDRLTALIEAGRVSQFERWLSARKRPETE